MINPKCPGGILIPMPVEITHINLLVSLCSDIKYKPSLAASGVAQKGANTPGLISQCSVVLGWKSILYICNLE